MITFFVVTFFVTDLIYDDYLFITLVVLDGQFLVIHYQLCGLILTNFYLRGIYSLSNSPTPQG
jgi:hypothetical protein